MALLPPKIHVYQERTTCSGDGMMPAATHCRSTVKCHSASSRSGRMTNQGVGNRSFATLLLQAELIRRLAGRLRQELVGIVVGHFARHVPRNHAVVGEEFRDALDRFER